MFPNYYKRLGLNRSATREEIKKAYRKLALEFHPDINKNPDAHERFIEINEAYLILYDVEGRAKYDLEYDLHFTQDQARSSANQQKENTEQDKSQSERTYSRQESVFTDENLNDWSRKARQQGQDYAKMAFEEFSKMVLGFVKETGFQLGNTLLVFFGLILTMGGCGNLVFGLSTKGVSGNPILGLIILPIGLFLYMKANSNWDKH